MLFKFALLASMSGCLLAQQAAPLSASPHPEVADRYAKEAVVVQHFETIYRYAADGTGSKQMTVAMRIQTDAAVRQFGVLSLPYASANEHIDLDYVRVRRPDGTAVETPVADALEMPAEVTRQAPFYSDIKEKQIPVRSLRVGDTLEYRARLVRTRAEAPGQMWGSDSLDPGLVALDVSIELHLPTGKDVTVWSPSTKPVIREESGERIYRWSGSHTEPTVGPEAEKKKESEKTRVLSAAEVDDLRFGKYATIAWTSFKSWDAVGAWYRSLESDRVIPDADIKAKVAELVVGKTTDEAKARALYSYVATNVRYIGVALGVGRYQPHLASDVLRNQYGDCKDKHTLLAAMLVEAGFKPSAVLVGVGIRLNPDVPSPAAFNHLITKVSVSGAPVWLDATQEVAPYRALLSVVRDRDVLVVPETGAAKIEKTPATLPFPSFERFEATATLSAEGVADGHIVITARGDDEITFRSVIHQFSPGQYDEFIQRFSQNLGFGGTATHADISRPELTEEPMRIAYDYKRDKPGDWENFRMTPQVPPIFLPVLDEKDPPKVPIEIGLPRVETVAATMKLPEGWGATLPDAIHTKTAFAAFDKTYRVEKGTLYCDRRLEILEPKVPSADWKVYKKFTDDISIGSEPWVQLTSTGKRSAGRVPPPPSVDNEEAGRLLRQASGEIQARNFDRATEDLARAKELNDKQAYLWSSYGYLSTSQGNLTEAILSFRKELLNHPDELNVYQMIATSQLGLGHLKEAEETLRLRLSEGGPDEGVSLQLAALLSTDADFAGAVKVLDTANQATPGKLSLRLAMARAQMKSGQRVEGAASFKTIIGESDDPGVLNDAAYELADADIEVDLADATIRKALDKLTTGSATVTLDGDADGAMPRTRLIVAAWDTFGWVLFREHKNSEAEPYLRAAWLQMQHAESGLHLGQLQEARHDLNDALTTYSLASGAAIAYGMDGTRMPASPVAKQLAARIADLKSKGVKTSAPEDDKIERSRPPVATEEKSADGKSRPQVRIVTTTMVGSALQEIRTVQLGNAEGARGTREFSVVLAAGGVEAAKPSADKPALKSDEADSALVRRLDTKPWWPAGSAAKLVRKGALDCHESKCEFHYYPL